MLFSRPLIIESSLSAAVARARVRACATSSDIPALAAFRRRPIIGWRLSKANESSVFQPEYGDVLDVDGARELGAWKIDERIAFLSCDTPLRTPFGRGLRVIDSGPWNQKRLPAKLRELDIGVVDIRRRGLAGDVGQLLRRLRLTGSRRATVVMTRAKDRPWGLICVDAE